MRGFTLLETAIVIAILAILSLIGMLTIVSFQKDALLDSTAREFAASLKSARNKSVAGEIEVVGTGTPTIAYTANGLPEYGVKTTPNSYTIYSISDPPSILPTPTPIVIDSTSKLDITTTGDGDVKFDRLSGKTDSEDFTISNESDNIIVKIDQNGMVSVTKP